jgi:hypothetical protein
LRDDGTEYHRPVRGESLTLSFPIHRESPFS